MARYGGFRAWFESLRHHLRLLGVSSIVWIVLIAGASALVMTGWEEAYPTQLEREALATQVEGNPAFEALFGRARGIDQAGGFALWRVGGVTTVLAAVWAMLAATRITRGEEDEGHAELLLAGAVRRTGLLSAAAVALAIAVAALWAATFGSLSAIEALSAEDAAIVAGANAACAAVFGALGLALAQVAPSRTHAVAAGAAVIVLALLVRVASGVEALEALEWTTPFGWVNLPAAEDGGWRLSVFWLFAPPAAALAAAAFAMRSRRELGGSVLRAGDEERAGVPMRSLPVLAAREVTPGLLGWGIGAAAFTLLIGLLTGEVVRFVEASPGFVRLMEEVGFAGLDRPEGFVGLAMTFAVLIVALFAVTTVAGIRDDEASGRLEPILARPVSRWRWLAVRAAALNLLPIALLFFGIGLLAFAAVPRLTGMVAFGAVLVTFVFEFVGAFVDLPDVLLEAAPFHHFEPVPAADAAVGPALVMLAIGAAATLLAFPLFRGRDVEEA